MDPSCLARHHLERIEGKRDQPVVADCCNQFDQGGLTQLRFRIGIGCIAQAMSEQEFLRYAVAGDVGGVGESGSSPIRIASTA
jgi:hypothetical protein